VTDTPTSLLVYAQPCFSRRRRGVGRRIVAVILDHIAAFFLVRMIRPEPGGLDWQDSHSGRRKAGITNRRLAAGFIIFFPIL